LRRLLRDLLLILTGSAALWLCFLWGRTFSDSLLIAAWIIISTPIAAGLYWRRRLRRRVLLSAYLRSGRPLARWLRGGWLLAARQAGAGLLLGGLLLIALLRIEDTRVWYVLLAGGLLLVLVQAAARPVLRTESNPAYLAEVVSKLSLPLTGTLLVGALLLLAIYRSYPDFSGVSLERAVWHLVDQQQARSGIARSLLELAAAKDALRLWLGQQLMPQPGISLAQLAGWLVLLAEEVLFAWSYLLLCNGLLLGAEADDRAAD